MEQMLAPKEVPEVPVGVGVMREMVAEVGGKKIWADEALHRVVGKTMAARGRY